MVKVAVWDTDENYLRKEKRLVDQYMRVHGYQYCIESPASEVDLMIIGDAYRIIFVTACRSEERRVGKECRSRWSPYH